MGKLTESKTAADNVIGREIDKLASVMDALPG